MRSHWTAFQFRLAGPARDVVIALGLAGVASIILVGWKFGLGTSNDGVLYLSAARHFIDGSGLTDFRGDPLIIFPPLYSILLGILGIVTPTVDTAAWLLQVLVYAGNFALAAILLARIVRDKIWFFAGVMLLAGSRTFLLYHYYVLSEPLFVLLTLSMILVLCRHRENGRSSLVLWAAIFAALSCLTRYTGVANVLAGSFILVLSGRPTRRKLVDAGTFTAVSLTPLIAWLIRNAVLADSLTGERLPSPYPFLLNLQLVADSIALWFVPDEVPQWIRLILVLAGVVVLGLVLRRMTRAESAQSSASDRTILASAVASHLIVLIVATSIFASDYISTRLVMPVYVPVVLLSVTVLAWLFERVRSLRTLIATLLFGWMAIQFITSARLVFDRYAHGVGGYATGAWAYSDVMEFVNENSDSLGTDVFSNAALGVYHHTRLVVNFLPDRLNPRWASDYPADELGARPTIEHLQTLVDQPGSEVSLIWFDIAGRDPKYESIYLFNQYRLEEIEGTFEMEPIFESDDGGVYRLTNRPDAGADSLVTLTSLIQASRQ